MKKEYLKFNYVEVSTLQRQLKEKEKSLELTLKSLKEKIKIIERILKDNDDHKQDWIILLPSEILGSAKQIEETEKRTNWKRLVLTIMSKYDQPMTSEMIYFKSRLNFHEIPNDRQQCIANISAALHYLSHRDGKLMRMKEVGRKSFIYGYPHFFDKKGIIKEEYYGKFKVDEIGPGNLSSSN